MSNHRTILGPGAIFPGGGVESAPEAPVAAPVAPAKPEKPAKAKPVIVAPVIVEPVEVKPLQVIEANDDMELPVVTLPVDPSEPVLAGVSEETHSEATAKKTRKSKKSTDL